MKKPFHLFEEFEHCYNASPFAPMSDTKNTSPDDQTRSRDAEQAAPIAPTVTMGDVSDKSDQDDGNGEVELIEKEDIDNEPDSPIGKGDVDEEEGFSIIGTRTLSWPCSCCVENG